MQQINLYEVTVEPNVLRDLYPLPQLLVVLVLVLAAVYGYSWTTYLGVKKQLSELEYDQTDVELQLEQLNVESEQEVRADPALKRQLALLQAKMAEKQSLLRTVKGIGVGGAIGFSSYLEGLARQDIEGLWLTRIDLLEGGGKVGLHGMVTKADQLPVFLRKLSAESAFGGTEFDVFKLQHSTEAPALMSFGVSTALEQGEGFSEASAVEVLDRVELIQGASR